MQSTLRAVPVFSTSPRFPGQSQRRKLKTIATHLFIAVYLSWLGHGFVCHALQYRVAAHPMMYFTVWDMFCGWSGWSYRTHVIAEGESGQFYALTPTPWGEYHPYGNLGREHYDSFGRHAANIGVNCLNQTQHEPMKRLLVIEETWSKKFNLPDPLWHCIHEEPRRPNRYFHVNSVFEPDGRLISRHPSFHETHRASWLAASLRGQSGGATAQETNTHITGVQTIGTQNTRSQINGTQNTGKQKVVVGHILGN
jgi:hypothetical protein